ncbi:MAG: dTMP kinase [Defluviitaleaceae bacterium]|nr:dTMP kinase [Defluviitaleaceae bacterium]
MDRGVFIAFEGLDGSGKTTQMAAVLDKLRGRGIDCRGEREPSNGRLGLIARQAIKKEIDISSDALALLFAADRVEHIKNDILPFVKKGVHVLTDRFVLSNFAYQGLDHDFDELMAYNRRAMDILLPDLTIFIDVNPAVCFERIEAGRISKDRFDNEGARICENFRKAIGRLESRMKILTINGNQPAEIITGEIWKLLEPIFFSKEN